MSEAEDAFAGQLRALFLHRNWDQDAIVREYKFCPERRWRADFAIVKSPRYPGAGEPWDFSYQWVGIEGVVLVEIEGGIYPGSSDDTSYPTADTMTAAEYQAWAKDQSGGPAPGRHVQMRGYTDDCYKYSCASALGYTVLRGTSKMVRDGTLLLMVEQVLMGECDFKMWRSG